MEPAEQGRLTLAAGFGEAAFGTSMALFEKSGVCTFAVVVGFLIRRAGRTGAEESVRVALATEAGRGSEGADAGTLFGGTAVLSLLVNADDVAILGSGAGAFSTLAACRFAAMVSLMLCFDFEAADLTAAADATLGGGGPVAASEVSLLRTLRC